MATKRAKTTRLDDYIQMLWDAKGTDLLLTVGAPPLVRVDGQLQPLEGAAALGGDDTEALVRQVVTSDQWEMFSHDRELDFSFDWEGLARMRGNVFLQRGAVTLALRMIPREIPTFDDIGLPDVIRQFVDLPQGFILVTGPTGSGKSTTLASIIDRINIDRRVHILTIEDPIEYVHDHKNSAVNQREVGSDSASFDQALRSALREDPDVLLVGEMRDLESIQTALTIAETGHLVFATLHTNDTAQAIDRIVDIFPADRRTQIQVQLSHVLSGVVYQRLIPRVEGGLVAAYEVLLGNSPARNLIREGKTKQLRNVITTHTNEGMRTLEMSLNELMQDGTIDMDTALGVSMYPRELEAPRPMQVAVGGEDLAVGKRRRR